MCVRCSGEALSGWGLSPKQMDREGGFASVLCSKLLREAQGGGPDLGQASLCRGEGFWSPLAWLAGYDMVWSEKGEGTRCEGCGLAR